MGEIVKIGKDTWLERTQILQKTLYLSHTYIQMKFPNFYTYGFTNKNHSSKQLFFFCKRWNLLQFHNWSHTETVSERCLALIGTSTMDPLNPKPIENIEHNKKGVEKILMNALPLISEASSCNRVGWTQKVRSIQCVYNTGMQRVLPWKGLLK